MVTQEQLKNLYETQLKPELASLEKQRKIVAWLYRISIAFYVCTGLAFISIFIQADSLEDSAVFTRFGIMFGCAIVGLFIRLGIAQNLRKKYRLVYKTKVVERVISAIEPEWNYQADAHVGALEFKSSKLFSRSYDLFSGDDLVSGKIDKTDFRSSELDVKYQVGSGDNKEFHSLFGGFFFHADRFLAFSITLDQGQYGTDRDLRPLLDQQFGDDPLVKHLDLDHPFGGLDLSDYFAA